MALNFTVRRGVMVLKGCGGLIRLISFVVDPDVLKRVLKLVHRLFLESEPDLTRWDTVSIDHYLCLVFPTHH